MAGQIITPQNFSQLRENRLVDTPGKVTAAAFSPDSRWLALAHEGGIGLWSLATRERIHAWDTPSKVFVFAPDGSALWVATQNHLLRCDTDSGEQTQQFAISDPKINQVAISSDGTRLIGCSWQSTVYVWAPDGALLATLSHNTAVKQAVFSADRRALITRAGMPTTASAVMVWDTVTWETVHHFSFDKVDVWSMAVHPLHNWISVGVRAEMYSRTRNAIHLYDFGTGNLKALVESPPHYENYVLSLAYHPSGDLLAAVTSDSQVHVLHGADLTPISGWETPFVQGAQFSPDGQWLITTCTPPMVSNDRPGLNLFSLQSGGHQSAEKHESAARVPTAAVSVAAGKVPAWSHVALLDAHARRVLALAFSADGRQLVSGGEDATLHVWNLDRGESVQSFAAGSAVEAVAFHPAGDQVAGLNQQRTVQMWSLKRQSLGQQAARELGTVSRTDQGLDYHPSGNYLSSGSVIFETQTGKVLKCFLQHRAPHNAGSFHPDGTVYALGVGGDTGYSGSVDNHAKLYAFPDGQLIGQLPHDHYVLATRFAAGGRLLVTLGWRHVLSVWDWRAETCLLDSKQDVQAFAVDPSGEWLALAMAFGGIHLLRLNDLADERPLGGFDRKTSALAFSPDGVRLAAADGNRIWVWCRDQT